VFSEKIFSPLYAVPTKKRSQNYQNKKEIFAVDKTFFLKNLPYFAFFIRGNKKLAKKTFCTSSSLLSVQSQRKNIMENKK